MEKEKVLINIISKPDTVKFICPVCGEETEFNYNDSIFSDANWSDIIGSEIECSNEECEAFLEIESWEYD